MERTVSSEVVDVPRTALCPCGSPARRGQRTCRGCHAAYMRVHRPRHRDLPAAARARANARAYANTYQHRGQLIWWPCAGCGATDPEKHHEDYTQPLAVRWLCRRCHLARHQ